MDGISITTTNLIIKVIILIWIMSLTRSVILMFCGKLYTKASKSSKIALYPVLNMFTMLEIVDLSPFLGILLFTPVLNLIVLFLMSFKLAKVYNASISMKIGLIFFPVVFYPLLARSDVYYKVSSDEYLKALDSAKNESVNLMTQEEINDLNETHEQVTNNVDSIFKGISEIKEEAEPYKAVKIDKDILDNVNKLEFNDTTFKPIEKTEDFETLDTSEQTEEKKPQSMFTSELEKEEKLEFFDL